MSGLLGIFNIGKLSLSADQNALSVTSNNIANANTAGYSVEHPVFEATAPVNGQPGQVGTGVEISQIQRMVNGFVESQLTSGQSTLGQLQTNQDILGQIEALFSNPQGTGISQGVSNFFAAFQDLSSDPQGSAQRSALLSQAQTLAQEFSSTEGQMKQVQSNVNTEINGLLGTANSLASQIAGLNGQISQAQMAGQQPNTLLDQRGNLVNQLAKIVGVNTFQDAQGQLTVMVAGGSPLVEGTRANTLQGVVNPDNAGFSNVELNAGNGTTVDLTSSLTGGQLQGLLNLRDSTIPGYLNQLDQLAAAVVNETNQQQQAGFGLDGSTGNNFFNPLNATVSPLSTNGGSGTVTATISSPAALTFDNYQVSFSGGNYTIANQTTGATVSGAYASPTNATFEGIQFNLSGAPASGDRFTVSVQQGAAGSMAVSLTDPKKIAAASSAAGLPGDNSNALLLAQLQNKPITALGGATFQGFYGSFVSDIGSQSQAAQNGVSAQTIVQQNLTNLSQQTSGVNLDEELTNLIQYQRAYQASAHIITMADQLMQTIIGMVA